MSSIADSTAVAALYPPSEFWLGTKLGEEIDECAQQMWNMVDKINDVVGMTVENTCALARQERRLWFEAFLKDIETMRELMEKALAENNRLEEIEAIFK